MCGKYGQAAVLATQHYCSGAACSPPAAWALAVSEIFPNSMSSQDKGCPKGAFLGLCEDGFVAGIPQGSYTKSRLNKGYAIGAVDLLRADPDLCHDADALWDRVIERSSKTPNSQMDVVLSLWLAGLINSKPGCKQ